MTSSVQMISMVDDSLIEVRQLIVPFIWNIWRGLSIEMKGTISFLTSIIHHGIHLYWWNHPVRWWKSLHQNKGKLDMSNENYLYQWDSHLQYRTNHWSHPFSVQGQLFPALLLDFTFSLIMSQERKSVFKGISVTNNCKRTLLVKLRKRLTVTTHKGI